MSSEASSSTQPTAAPAASAPAVEIVCPAGMEAEKYEAIRAYRSKVQEHSNTAEALKNSTSFLDGEQQDHGSYMLQSAWISDG